MTENGDRDDQSDHGTDTPHFRGPVGRGGGHGSSAPPRRFRATDAPAGRAGAVDASGRRPPDAEREAMARLMSRDGHRRFLGTKQIEKSLGCRYYADHASAMLADERFLPPPAELRRQSADRRRAAVSRELSLLQVVRFAAPALMEETSASEARPRTCTVCPALEDLFTRAGFPSGVFQTCGRRDAVAGSSPTAVTAVTCTGSEARVRRWPRRRRAPQEGVLELGQRSLHRHAERDLNARRRGGRGAAP